MNLLALSNNLRRLRTARDLSQSALAERALLSREGYRRIEEGQVEPKLESLQAIAKALAVRVNDLLAPSRELGAVRFRAGKKLATRGDILARTAQWLDNYRELEALVGNDAPYRLPELREAADGLVLPEEKAIAVRAALIKGSQTIRDVCGLLEDNGIKVFAPQVHSDAFFGLSVVEGTTAAVVVNCWERIAVERWIFTAVHELGHLVMHLGAYAVAKEDEDPQEEDEANRFASEFLMPQALFASEWEQASGLSLVDRVFKLKRIFRVSWKTVIYRLTTAQKDPSLWAKFNRAYVQQTGKKLRANEEPDNLAPGDFASSHASVVRAADEPEHLTRADFIEDRLARLVREAMTRDLISMSRGAEILGLDLRQMRAQAKSWLS